MSTYFDEINARLSDREWLFRQFSVVDGYLFAFAYWAQRIFHMDLAAAFPHLHAHFERMLKRSSVQEVLKDEADLAAAA